MIDIFLYFNQQLIYNLGNANSASTQLFSTEFSSPLIDGPQGEGVMETLTQPRRLFSRKFLGYFLITIEMEFLREHVPKF